ncbi:hypothetical protein ACH5RR_038989 [Cinchona calisaya]|uniref:Uncharacterized protein n=1 Tax=Cinchona calisaya TaxID=153742 RepID=A0ABD2XWW5_9GENT
MSLNCLTCPGMKRTDSDVDMKNSLCQRKPNTCRNLATTERSWSGNLVPRPNGYGKIRTGRTILMAADEVKKGRYRIHNSAPAGNFEDTGTPKLVRSSGMRRDWSFEDLRRMNGYNYNK